MIERGKIQMEEKSKHMEKSIDDLAGKIGIITELEKRIKKKFREMSENNEFMGKLNEKAD